MHVTLIGMSNIGKTLWAGRLAAAMSAEAVECDQLIEQKLGPDLSRMGYAGIRDMAKWMDQPFGPQYPETSRKYVECERAVMQDIIARLRSAKKPMVIDTTGSVIYSGDDVLDQLRELTRVVYFEASEDHVAELFARYVAEPKPVIWGGAFAQKEGETPENALKRCYPELLGSRARRYSEIAHVTIPFEQHRNPQTDLLSLI